MARVTFADDELNAIVERVVAAVLAAMPKAPSTSATPRKQGAMAIAFANLPAPITKTDKKFGYRIGCEGWATVKEAAVLMGCSDRTVERYIEAGRLRAYKLDASAQGGVRVCRRSIAEYVGGNEKTGVSS